MQQKVDLSRLQELSASLDRISRNLEREAFGIERGINNTLSRVRDEYQQEWYVGQSAGKAEALLRDVLSQTKIILDELNRQSAAVREAAEQYGYTESKMKALLNAKFMRKFPAVQRVGGIGARLWDMWRRRQEQGGERLLELLSGKPLLKDLLKAAVTSVQDLQLETRLIPYSSEPRITELLDKLHTGDEDLREAARMKLNEIANAFDTLARSQAAYSVYAAYDHKQYMEQVKQTAAAQRDILAGLGVDPAWYGPEISLRKHYNGPLLSACDYNPLQSDFSPMPKEEELRLVIAIGMTVPAYQDWAVHNYPEIEKAAKKRAAELERQREIRQQLMEEYNQKFSPEDIRAMQEALKKRGMYPGEITGQYNEEFLLAVEKFQGMQGRKPDGSFDDTLLALAKSTEEAGLLTPVAVGEGIVVQLGSDALDTVVGAVNLVPDIYELAQAIRSGQLGLDDLKAVLSETVQDELLEPLGTLNRLTDKVMNGTATYAESKEWGKAVARVGAVFIGGSKVFKEGLDMTGDLAKKFKDAAPELMEKAKRATDAVPEMWDKAKNAVPQMMDNFKSGFGPGLSPAGPGFPFNPRDLGPIPKDHDIIEPTEVQKNWRMQMNSDGNMDGYSGPRNEGLTKQEMGELVNPSVVREDKGRGEIRLNDNGLTKEQDKYFRSKIDEAEARGDLQIAENIRYERYEQRQLNLGKPVTPREKWSEKQRQLDNNRRRGRIEEENGRKAIMNYYKDYKFINNNEGTVKTYTSTEGHITRPDSLGYDFNDKLVVVHDHKHKASSNDQIVYNDEQMRAQKEMVSANPGSKHSVTMSSDNPDLFGNPPNPRPSGPLSNDSEIFYAEPESGKITHRWIIDYETGEGYWSKLE